MSKIEQYIVRIDKQLRIQTALKAFLAGLSVAIFSMIFTTSTLAIGLVLLASFGVAAHFLGLFRSKRFQAVRVMHEQFQDLEFSLELLDKADKNTAEKLQFERVNEQFRGGDISLWFKNTGPFLVALAIASSVFGLYHLSSPETNSPLTLSKHEYKSPAIAAVNLPIELTSTEVNIVPPGYTRLPKVTQSELEIEAIKNSDVEWVISLSNSQDLKLELINSNGDGLEFAKNEDSFTLRDRVVNSGIYALRASKDGQVVFETGFFPLQAIDDLAPVIQPTEKELYKYHFTKDPKTISVAAKVSDDFVVKEVFLVATLARGSGENVRFRESRIPIPQQNFKSRDLTVTLDLNSFDFNPGDELYYYWAAMDNRLPEPNFSRSDTYFINYVDSTGVDEQELIGMAIHVMPEYFRSQRQIIIDTENLISTKKSKSEKEFNSTSNEIGSDQKLLRMRYGQYLGEENSDTNAGSEAVDFLAGHDHDHSHEGIVPNLTPTKETATKDSTAVTAPQNTGEDGLGGLMSAFLNNTQTKTKAEVDQTSSLYLLKLAIEEMWESELHLRLFEPEKALPFQIKALEYLKTVQQKSRAYVKRSGFDPPPLKEEEKRLTGDLDDLKNQLEKEQIEVENRLAPLASQVLGLLPKQELSANDKAVVQKFGELWTERMNYTGMQDWSVLLELQELNSGKIDEEGRKLLFQKLYPLIAQSEGVNASFLKNQKLEKAFWSKLQ
ncbi:hypothetical protein [Algoriphagus yeomjeoni]|uniref:Tryptophan-rich sensory protein n=1 Tax=Algoriphagus yeomjeoni TaxID=291403 RepID=A0A327PB82_9BACT|nr:hypothetical protein [Algoriphagus yeomjeoni]RAI88464.1 hypothetical protein LV83_02764 [Algoriphagus yeomjeoni]